MQSHQDDGDGRPRRRRRKIGSKLSRRTQIAPNMFVTAKRKRGDDITFDVEEIPQIESETLVIEPQGDGI